jgi:L-ornithine Nalpha-acyltransferase
MNNINIKHFSKEIVKPTLLADSEHFLIKIAESEEEIEKTLRLRYTVFNLEQGKGLDKSEDSGVDVDEFDEYCLQMIVVNKETNNPVGTYRVHLGAIASSAKGFYSANEYSIAGLDKIANATMEVGRSCVLPEFRSGAAVALLWGGIGELMMRAKLQYLMGCVSLEVNNPAAAWAIFEYLKRENKITDKIWGTPNKAYVLERPAEEEIEKYLLDLRGLIKNYMPPLMKGYLRLGTKICGEPVYDSEFGTIDFLILLDSFTIPERYAIHYNYKPQNG